MHISSDFPDWEIVVIEQAEESTLSTHPFVENINYTLAINPGPFNKSWGMNVASKQSSGEILVVSDCDMIVRAADMQRAVDACESELDAVRPYGLLIDVTADESEVYMQYGELPDVPAEARGYDRAYASEALCMAGGIFITRREFYNSIGGMDERFSGWGGEDDAMSIKLQGMSRKVAIAKNAIAWHLWHPREERYKHDGYQENSRLLQQYKSLNKTELLLLCQRQMSCVGNKEKYLERRIGLKTLPEQLQPAVSVVDIERLIPDSYSEVIITGPSDYKRKFCVVIPSCGRLQYLKQCMASLSKSDLSQATVCIVDETGASKVKVDGFTSFEGIDSPGMDISSTGPAFSALLSTVENEPTCNLFNELGYLKYSIQPEAGLVALHSRQALYVRNSYLDEHPGLKEHLDIISTKPDKETAEFIRQFSIKDVPVIKVFKPIHFNMFDSLRVGWDMMSQFGCEYLVNLDADAIVNTQWLNRLQLIYDKYKKQHTDTQFILTGFNTLSHETVSRFDEYEIKKTVGGINLFFHRSLYHKIVRPELRDINWDHALSEKLAIVNGSIVAAVPSVVQHIGESGLWSRPGKFDVSVDFIE